MKIRYARVGVSLCVLLVAVAAIEYASNPWNVFSPTVARDGQTVYFAVQKGLVGSIFKTSLRGGTVDRVTKGFFPNHSGPAPTPDGRALIISIRTEMRRDSLALFSLEDGTSKPLTYEGGNDFGAVSSRDGKSVYFVRSARWAESIGGWVDQDIYSIELTTGRMQRLTNKNCFSISAPSVSADDRWLLVGISCREHEVLWRFLADGSGRGEPIRPVDEHGRTIDCAKCASPRFSADGKRILYIQPNYTPAYTSDSITVIDAQTSRISRQIDTGVYVSEAEFVSGSNAIIFSGTRTPGRRDARHSLWLVDANGKAKEVPLDGLGLVLWLRLIMGV